MTSPLSEASPAVTVVARLFPQREHADRAAAAIRAAVAGIRAEDGCLQYEPHQADDGSFVIIERWSSRSTLAAHNVGPAVQVLRDGVAGLMDAPTEVLVSVAL